MRGLTAGQASARPGRPGKRRRAAHAAAVAAVAGAALLTAACGSGGGGSSPAPANVPFASLYKKAAATNGGNVVLYTHLSGATQQHAIAQAFEAEYPNMHLQVTGLDGQQEIERFVTEKQAGKNLVDVIQYPGSTPFETNIKQYIQPFTPTSASEYTTAGTYIKGFAYPWSVYQMAACYNPDKVSPGDVAKLSTYQGWADPTWKGRAAIAAPNGGTYLRGWTYWIDQDKSLGPAWLQEIKKNVDPTPFSDGESADQQVEAGQYAVAFGVLNVDQPRAAVTGAPLKCVLQQYTVEIPAMMGLVKNGPNPAGGQLFIDWQLSRAGQVASQQATQNLSAEDQIKGQAPAGTSDWQTPKKTVTTDEGVVAAKQQDVISLFNQTFGGGQ